MEHEGTSFSNKILWKEKRQSEKGKLLYHFVAVNKDKRILGIHIFLYILIKLEYLINNNETIRPIHYILFYPFLHSC